jgi:hypothetical protein
MRPKHPFAEGEPVEVRWPDGTVDTAAVKHRSGKNRVGDHGHNYTSCFQIPGFEVEKNGYRFWLPLDDVEVSSDSLERHRDAVKADPSKDPNRGMRS